MRMQEKKKMNSIELHIGENTSEKIIKLIVSSQILCSHISRDPSNKASGDEWKAIVAACKYVEKNIGE